MQKSIKKPKTWLKSDTKKQGHHEHHNQQGPMYHNEPGIGGEIHGGHGGVPPQDVRGTPQKKHLEQLQALVHMG